MLRKLILFPLSILLLCVAIYVLGLTIFALNALSAPSKNAKEPEAIIILTGDADRITQGLTFFDKKEKQPILISGVGKDTTLPDILPKTYQSYQCCLTLGYEAQDTIGNAHEAYTWLDKQDVASFTLVTSAYHMPRASFLFKKHKEANKYDMHTYATKITDLRPDQKAFWALMFTEYHKLIYTWGTGQK